MEPVMRAVIEAIHGSPTQVVLHLSGGASQAVGWLLSVPGASATILEVTVPYSRASMVQLIGKLPSQFVSRETANDLALAAYNRALRLSMPGVPVAGIGFTGALVSGAPKRGEHRCYVTARTLGKLWEYDITLSKGLRDRVGEDQVTSRVLLKTLADVCGVQPKVPLDLNESDEMLREFSIDYTEDDKIQQLLSGEISSITFGKATANEGRRVVLCGSFNPLHEGHVKLLDTACSLSEGGIPCFEMSALNPDKPPLSLEVIKSRVKQFEDRGKVVVVTNQPYFYKKAELFPDSSFVVGFDTAIRLLNPKYYGGSQARMLEVMYSIKQLGCDFLVAGRKVDGRFQVLSDVGIPDEIEGLFNAVPQDLFQMDISSTEIRNRSQSTENAKI